VLPAGAGRSTAHRVGIIVTSTNLVRGDFRRSRTREPACDLRADVDDIEVASDFALSAPCALRVGEELLELGLVITSSDMGGAFQKGVAR